MWVLRGFADIRYNNLASYIAESLLEWQPSDIDGRNKLTGQNYNVLVAFLATYQERSSVFKAIQNIEKYIIEKHPELKRPEDEHFCKEGTNIPKRNNFSSLLQLLDNTEGVQLTEDEKKLIVSIRNSFSHNSYKVDIKAATNEKIELPKVADLLLKIIENYKNHIVNCFFQKVMRGRLFLNGLPQN